MQFFVFSKQKKNTFELPPELYVHNMTFSL